jgi:multiple antibiotic resistance protein
MNELLLAFIPLFVAIDVLGLVPIYVGLTERMDAAARRRLVTEATVTAAALSVAFLFFGTAVFRFLGITEDDFRVGGGVVLLVLAVVDLITTPDESRAPGESPGVVPIGIPLIMGPAALTTILILVESHGHLVAVTSVLLNLVIVWMVFRHADRVLALMGRAGARAVAKVAALFMAAIAVMMIRVGLTGMLGG